MNDRKHKIVREEIVKGDKPVTMITVTMDARDDEGYVEWEWPVATHCVIQAVHAGHENESGAQWPGAAAGTVTFTLEESNDGLDYTGMSSATTLTAEGWSAEVAIRGRWGRMRITNPSNDTSDFDVRLTIRAYTKEA